MGFFSNGTEAAIFEEINCARCIHGDPETGTAGLCPVMTMHALWNYSQEHDAEKRAALDTLMSRSEDGLSNRCLMFHERRPAEQDTGQLALFEEFAPAEPLP